MGSSLKDFVIKDMNIEDLLNKAIENSLNKGDISSVGELLSKGKPAQIGEIRFWGGKQFRKIQQGKWEEITSNGNKRRASSGMKRILIDEWENINNEIKKKRKELYDEIISGANTKDRSEVFYRYLVERAIKDGSTATAEILRTLYDKADTISNEIKEVQSTLLREQKLAREQKVGKREITKEDILPTLVEFSTMKSDCRKLPTFLNAVEALGETVSSGDYFLYTETTFTSIIPDKLPEPRWKSIDAIWKKMKESGRYEYHQSPKSSSEYLVDSKTGDIYRYADHWGRVASCVWNLDDRNYSFDRYNICKSNFNNFKRIPEGAFVNQEREEAIAKTIKVILAKTKEMVEGGRDFYLDKEAKKLLGIEVGGLNNLWSDSMKRERENILNIIKLCRST